MSEGISPVQIQDTKEMVYWLTILFDGATLLPRDCKKKQTS